MNKKDTISVSQYNYYDHILVNPSERSYALWYLLDLADEATAWDQIVLEEAYTAADVVESLAYWMDIDSSDYENYDLLFEKVEDQFNKAEQETEFGFSF